MTTGGTKVFSTKVDGSKVIKPFILPKEEFYKLKYCSTVVYMVPRA
jgi:hypothetical protein